MTIQEMQRAAELVRATPIRPRKVIHLRATSRNIPIPAYVAAIRRAKADPGATFRHGLETWWPVSGADIVTEYRRAAADRINRRLPYYGQGRKWSDDWQQSARRVAEQLKARVLTRSRECPADLRERLAHRLYGPDDF